MRLGTPSIGADRAAAVGQVCLGYLLGGLGGCLVLLSRDLDIPREHLAWLSAGFGASLILVGVSGRVILRIGAVRVLRGACLCMGAGAMVLALAASLRIAQDGALLLGLGAACLVLTIPVLLAGPAVAARLTVLNGASSLAGMIAPLLIGAVDAVTGKGRLALLLPVAALLPVVAFVVPPVSNPERIAFIPPVTPAPAASSHGEVAVRWIAIVAAVCPEFAFVVWGAARLQDCGLAATAAASAAMAFPMGLGIGRLLAPRYYGRFPAVTLGAALGAVGGLIVAAPFGPVPVASGMALAGLGLSVLYPLTLARLVQSPGLRLQQGSALGAIASGVAVLGAPFVLSLIATGVGLRSAYLAVLPPLAVVVAAERFGARSPAPSVANQS